MADSFDIPAYSPSQTGNVIALTQLSDLAASAHHDLKASPGDLTEEARVRRLRQYADEVYEIGAIEGAMIGAAVVGSLWGASKLLSN